MQARSEPLLWVQLIGAGAFPLEGLLLLLLLAGSDPGPVPGLERLLCWALGALAPTLVLWHRPADVWSVLLLQTPLRARRPLQQRLSRLQDSQALRLALALGGLLALPLLWWLDEHAAVASALSPLQDSPRLVVLLLAAALLAVMLWQWQQLLQALWLLTRTPAALDAVQPMPQAELEERRLSLGLPLLLPEPLRFADSPERTPRRAGPPQASPLVSSGSAADPASGGGEGDAGSRSDVVPPQDVAQAVSAPLPDRQGDASRQEAPDTDAATDDASLGESPHSPAPQERASQDSASSDIVLQDAPPQAFASEDTLAEETLLEDLTPADDQAEISADAVEVSQAGRDAFADPAAEPRREVTPAVDGTDGTVNGMTDPASADGVPVPVEPEQPTEERQGGQLDQQIG